MNIKKLAKKIPFPVKRSLKRLYGAIPPRFRYGKVFWDTYNFLQESQWWKREKLEDYQMQELGRLLRHAYENVPYYRRIFDERELKPKDIRALSDFKKLPCLTKDVFKSHFNDFVANNFKLSSLYFSHTSGTSGKALQFYENAECIAKEWAFICHQWARVGYKPGDKRVELRGAIIEGAKPVEYNPADNIIRLSPRIDSKEIAAYYLQEMSRFDANYLHGYPSAIMIFASMIKQHGLSASFKLKAVLFASEAVYPSEKEITQEVFGCRVFSHYGMSEKTILAGECEHSQYYHCLPQYGITEIDVATNEIIGTSFLNYANPFIRYRTTDIASQVNWSKCKGCGREYFPIFSGIEGRIEDFIVTPKGLLISPAIMTHPFKDLKTIKNTQIIQKDLDNIILKVDPWGNCSPKALEDELRQLCHDLQKILGAEMKIETELVESIQLSSSGKFKWIVSEISKNFLEKGINKI